MEKQPNQSPLNAMSLNDLLDKIENNLGRLGEGMGVDPKEILLEMDEASNRLKNAGALEHPPKSEEAQFDYIGKTLQKYASLFLRTIGGAGALNALRTQQNPPPGNWWWFIDQWLEEKRSASLRKSVTTTGIVVIILVTLIFVYQRFLAPDKITQQKYDSISNAQQSMATGDYASALNSINLALSGSPNDTDLMIYKGVLLTKLGQQSEADKVFAEAEKILNNHEALLATRTLDYLQAGDPKSAKASAQELIATNPKSAEGYFYLAKSEELLGEQTAALDTYNQAFTLADTQGKSELAATIKISMAMMMQTMNSQFQLPTVVTTPTAPAK
jgi:tetratricopeptide (TPR) repeat protein